MSINPYESPHADSTASLSAVDRSKLSSLWLALTLPAHGVGFLFFVTLICGCHFHLYAALISAIPIACGTLAFFACRNRFIAYGNGLLVIAWLFIAWQSNLQFLFRNAW